MVNLRSTNYSTQFFPLKLLPLASYQNIAIVCKLYGEVNFISAQIKEVLLDCLTF